MSDSDSVSILAELAYADPRAALTWLETAFGLEPRLVVSDADGKVVFSEIGLGGRTVAIIPQAPPMTRNPRALGASSLIVHITGDFDIDSHCAKARANGAEILQEPETTPVGRIYVARDPEGHVWSFRKRVEEMGAMPEGWTVRFPAAEHG